eukprot:gene27436-biopygen104149
MGSLQALPAVLSLNPTTPPSAPPVTPCVDTPGYVDELGFRCVDWAAFNCLDASGKYGYTPVGQERLLENCALTCMESSKTYGTQKAGLCGYTAEPSSSVTSPPSVVPLPPAYPLKIETCTRTLFHVVGGGVRQNPCPRWVYNVVEVFGGWMFVCSRDGLVLCDAPYGPDAHCTPVIGLGSGQWTVGSQGLNHWSRRILGNTMKAGRCTTVVDVASDGKSTVLYIACRDLSSDCIGLVNETGLALQDKWLAVGDHLVPVDGKGAPAVTVGKDLVTGDTLWGWTLERCPFANALNLVPSVATDGSDGGLALLSGCYEAETINAPLRCSSVSTSGGVTECALAESSPEVFLCPVVTTGVLQLDKGRFGLSCGSGGFLLCGAACAGGPRRAAPMYSDESSKAEPRPDSGP